MIGIIGAGGLGRELLYMLLDHGYCREELVFADDDPGKHGKYLHGVPTISVDEYLSYPNDPYFLAIGDPVQKFNVNKRFRGKAPQTFIHGDAFVNPNAQIGMGCIIAAGAHITADVSVGSFSVINMNSVLAHDVSIGSCCLIAPGVVLNGYTTVADNVFIGSNVSTIPHAVIGKNSIIGAGAVVKGTIPPWSVAVGVPAKVIKTLDDTNKPVPLTRPLVIPKRPSFELLAEGELPRGFRK